MWFREAYVPGEGESSQRDRGSNCGIIGETLESEGCELV